MIDKNDIIAAAEEALAGGELFLVEVNVRGDEVEVFIDSDGRVSVEDCVGLTRAIEDRFDRDVEDFSLTVSSAGIGQPLRVPRQYKKLAGKRVDVVLNNGMKLPALLERAEGDSITLSYPEKHTPEGRKRPEVVTVTKTFPLADIKTTKEHIDFN